LHNGSTAAVHEGVAREWVRPEVLQAPSRLAATRLHKWSLLQQGDDLVVDDERHV
jgi:hypothetical protein